MASSIDKYKNEVRVGRSAFLLQPIALQLIRHRFERGVGGLGLQIIRDGPEILLAVFGVPSVVFPIIPN